jgi:V/A-type H+-transporting ATPase subunit K
MFLTPTRHNFSFFFLPTMENAVLLSGPVLAFAGAMLAAGLGAIGSSYGCGAAGEATTVVTAEKPELKPKMILLQVMPGSQVIYGFVIAMMIIGAKVAEMTAITGAQILMAGLTMGLAALYSGIRQGRVIAAGTQAVAKDESQLGNVIIFAAVVETFAIFGFLVSFLMIQGATAA